MSSESRARRKGLSMLLAVNAGLAVRLLVLRITFFKAKIKIFNGGFSKFDEGVFADMAEAFVPIGKGEFLSQDSNEQGGVGKFWGFFRFTPHAETINYGAVDTCNMHGSLLHRKSDVMLTDFTDVDAMTMLHLRRVGAARLGRNRSLYKRQLAPVVHSHYIVKKAVPSNSALSLKICSRASLRV